MSEALIEAEVLNDTIDGDYLNRHDFIEQVKTVIELLSANKKNTCFAISGTWGIGKSYVIEKLENQLLYKPNEETVLDKYFVFHFNCWEYDYYEEPLMAIVSSMLDDINTKERLFTEAARNHISSAAKFVLSKLYEGFSKWLETTSGFNPKEITDGLSKINSDVNAKIEDANKYDEYFHFKQALSKLREEIKEIASERTIIFVVDELDRCVPEYQIKVLERLHHIFDGIDNMQVILAVDKVQLERTVQKMFGDGVDKQKYLAKFIKFEIELDEGTYSDQFEKTHGYYFNQFEYGNNSDVAEFKANIFNGIAAREKIEIVQKCHLLHALLNEESQKLHGMYMCIELYLTIVKHTKATLPNNANGIYFHNMFGDKPVNGLKFLEEKMSREFKKHEYMEGKVYYSSSGRRYIRPIDIWGILLASYATVTETRIDGYLDNRVNMNLVEEYSKEFWNLLKTIK